MSSYWDVVLEAEAAGLRADAYEFAVLPDGNLIVDEGCDEELSMFADAVEETLQPPYRAVAVRKERTGWTVSARGIELRTLPLEEGDLLRLDDGGRLVVDGAASDAPAVIAALGDLEAPVEGRRLDGGVWEIRGAD